MKLLLDTCTFLWVVQGSPRLSRRAAELFRSPDNEVYLSAASAWEIAMKHQLGRLALPDPPESFVPEMREAHGVTALPIDEEAALHLTRLPPVHCDPFDRMLVCQALVGGLVLLTPDETIRRYPVRTAW